MKKGVVFTMDAVFALYLSLLVMMNLMIFFESNKNYSDNSLALSRLSRDVFEVKRYAPSATLPTFIKIGSPTCDLYSTVGSATVLSYGDIQAGTLGAKSAISLASWKVCTDG